MAQFEGFYVNGFDIQWHEQSYLANAHMYPDLDYTHVKQSMGTQRNYNFVGPFPFARVVQPDEL